MSPITQSAESDEDYEEMMRRRRAESIQKKKEDEKQDRKNIIKAFHEKAKEKGKSARLTASAAVTACRGVNAQGCAPVHQTRTLWRSWCSSRAGARCSPRSLKSRPRP
jgi:hypothetical protein